MIRLGMVLSLSWVLACGDATPPAEEPARAPAHAAAAAPVPKPKPKPKPKVPIEVEKAEYPKRPDPVQPQDSTDYDLVPVDDGIEGDVEGGVVGGVIGGVHGGPPPPPPNQPQVVPQVALEQQRIAGDKNILPPDEVKLAMKRASQTRLVTALKMCLDANGVVAPVDVLKSSGHPSYDQLLTTTIERTWKYTPFKINGKPVPVCTAVTFIYNQRNSPDAKPGD
ncbi:MAG TPA: energy transducer TonB [Kofleriaceae bacterium]|nr:energy transducer TonB [Kofleriaceae bacterium]